LVDEYHAHLFLGLGFFRVFFTCFAAPITAAALAAAFETRAPVHMGHGIL
tara:strand:+ start:689 stop:838 length:150 start_codon:yes stop_codon:yes gene_type:complete